MTRSEWMNRVCHDLGVVLAAMDDESVLSAREALALAKSGAHWLLAPDAGDKTLGEALGLAALLIVMVRETCLENEQKGAPVDAPSSGGSS